MHASDEPRCPGRPSVPPAFWALLGAIFAAQSILRMQVGVSRCFDAVVIAVLVSVVLAAILAIWGKGPQARFVLAIASASCVVALSASFSVETARASKAALESSPVSEWTFLVTGDARLTQGRYRMRARARMAGSVSSDVWLYSSERLYPGMTVGGVGRMKELGEGGWAASSRAQGVVASIDMRMIRSISYRGGLLGMIDGFRRHALAMMRPTGSAARAFMAACTLGDRTGVDSLGADDVLQRCGISHLIAVSGTHLALVAGACTSLLERLSLHPKARAAVLGSSTGLFVLLCGAPPSAVRAWLMVLALIAGQTVGRRSHGASSLAAAALAMALLDPPVTGQLAYQLSVSAVLGIRVIHPYLRYLIAVLFSPRRRPRGIGAALFRKLLPLLRRIGDLVSLTITAQAVTLPITAPAFGEISLIAPLANLVATAPISLLTMAGLLSIALLPVPLAAEAVRLACEPVGNLLMRLLELISRIRWAAVPVGGRMLTAGMLLLAALLVLAWFSPNVTRRMISIPLLAVLLVCACWYGRNRYLAPARLCILDVGQGDAILIQEGLHAVLVDAGPPGSLAPALSRMGVLHIDAILLSHLHDDHYGGISDCPGSIFRPIIIVPAGSSGCLPEDLAADVEEIGAYPPAELGCGDTLSFGHFAITAIAPPGEVDGLENEDSQFLLVTFDDGTRTLSALLTGDGESAELAAALARSGLTGIDILKVGHHGSAGSITPAQAEALDPAFALCSAGRGNEFGHPAPETVEALVSAGARFLCTMDEGDIVMVPSADGASLKE